MGVVIEDAAAMPASPSGRAMAICIGVLGGGGLGFYYKERYWAKKKAIVRDELEKELHRLREERMDKEKLLVSKK